METSYPYNSAGSFMEYFQGLTYEHVNFIFDGHAQVPDLSDSTSSFYKFGGSRTGTTSHYDPSHAYEVHDHGSQIDAFVRSFGGSSPIPIDQNAATNTEWVSNENTDTIHGTPVDYDGFSDSSRCIVQAVWQDIVDPDSMTYEELLELGDAVGSQNRGLSKELISSLPVSKYKCCFFSRRKSRTERCVICQMEYKRGDKRITLPCKHIYHASCGSKWLSINKACPICYTEVFSDASKIKK
ncbi:E3 ubiquitin-protein ligase BIG BROTHER [Linum perenne]